MGGRLHTLQSLFLLDVLKTAGLIYELPVSPPNKPSFWTFFKNKRSSLEPNGWHTRFMETAPHETFPCSSVLFRSLSGLCWSAEAAAPERRRRHGAAAVAARRPLDFSWGAVSTKIEPLCVPPVSLSFARRCSQSFFQISIVFRFCVGFFGPRDWSQRLDLAEICRNH